MPAQSKLNHGRSHRAWAVATLVAAVMVVAAPMAAAVGVENNAPAVGPAKISAEAIDAWIGQLDSDLFITREEATRRLIAAGRPAIAPLAKAADGDQLETATRAIRVLLQLVEAEETATAREALSTLAKLKHRPVERKAARAVLDRFRETRALAEIIRLGGTERLRYTVGGREVVAQLVIGRQWKGGDDGLRLVADIRNLQTLSLHGAQVSDAGIAHLLGMAALRRIELYGTKVTRQGVAALHKAQPRAEIDYRRGALLGVQGIGGTDGARITLVTPGSAAAKAGLKPLDVIVKLDGQAVKDFKGLTELIGAHQPGEKASFEVLRGTQRLTIPVVYGGWQ